MNTIWQTVTWDVARAGGFTAYVLLTLAVVVGLALSTQLQSPRRWPRLLNNELHNFLTLLSTIFLVVHVLAVWIDPFTHFGWNEIFIPLASHYRPEWMALGIVALYLGIAIGISTLLRPHIGYTWWRRLHVLTLGIFALATIHGIATGSDTQTWWGLGIYLVSIILVGSLLCRRVFYSKGKRKPIAVHPVPPARNVSTTLQGNPRLLNGATGIATSITQQHRAEATRMK
jgi:predicted ferric reductase